MDSIRGHAIAEDSGPEAQPAGRRARARLEIPPRSHILGLVLQPAHGHFERGLPELASLPKAAEHGGTGGVGAERRPGATRQRLAVRLPPEGFRGVRLDPEPPDYSDELLLDLLRAGL